MGGGAPNQAYTFRPPPWNSVSKPHVEPTFKIATCNGQDGRSKVKTAESYICGDIINHAHVNKIIHMVLEGARRGGGAVSPKQFRVFWELGLPAFWMANSDMGDWFTVAYMLVDPREKSWYGFFVVLT